MIFVKDCRGKLFREKVFPCTPFKKHSQRKNKGIAHIAIPCLYLVGNDGLGVPKTNANRYIIALYVILSAGRHECRPKSNFCGLSLGEQAKARAFWRSGIWLKISVACQRNVTFTVESHGDFEPYPFVAFAPRFCIGSSPRAAHSLNKTSTTQTALRFSSLRMTYSSFV